MDSDTILASFLSPTTPMHISIVKSACLAIMGEDQTELRNLLPKVSLLGYEEDITKFAQAYSKVKTELEKENFALITKEANYMPLRTQEEIEFSDSYFNKYYYKFPNAWREKIACKISKKANFKLSPVTSLYSKRATVYIDFEPLQKLANTVYDHELQGVLSTLVKLSSYEPLKTVEYAEEICRDHGIPPLVYMYKQASKNEAEEAYIQLHTKSFSVKDISNMGYKKLAAAVGSTIAKSLCVGDEVLPIKVAMVVPTLPRDVKKTLELHLEI